LLGANAAEQGSAISSRWRSRVRPSPVLQSATAGLRITIGRGRLVNADELQGECPTLKPGHGRTGSSTPALLCTAHTFGASSLANDALRMRHSDVLVAAHGDELTFGFFMHAGAAVIEVRPYLFKQLGAWSDAYADAFHADRSIRHYVLQGDALSTLGVLERLVDGANVSAHDVCDLPIVCPRAALVRVLRRVTSANGSYIRAARQTIAVAERPAVASSMHAESSGVRYKRADSGARYRRTDAEVAALLQLPADPSFGARGLVALKARGALATVVSDDRIAWTMTLVDLVLRRAVAGDLIEAGTFTGGTSIAMLHALGQRAPGTIMWAADSFQGLPAPVKQDASCDRRRSGGNTCSAQGQGTFMSTRSTFEENLWRFDVNRTRLRVVEGWFSATLPTAGIRRRGLSLIRADGDLYTSTRDVLRALYQYLQPGGVIYIDDYGSFGGCGKAVDEFRDERNISAPLHEIWETHSLTTSKTRFFEAVWWTKGSDEPFAEVG